MKIKGIIAAMASFFGGALKGNTRSHSTDNPRYSGRFNLAGLPPAWKGRRMARIMRGGK